MLKEDEFLALMELCRIACTPEEKVKIRSNLERILDYIEQLQQAPMETVCPSLLFFLSQNAMREDTEGELISKEAFLEGAPETIGGLVRVPPVIKFE